MISRLFPNRRECFQGLKNTEIIRKTLTKIFEKAQWFFRVYFYFNNTPPHPSQKSIVPKDEIFILHRFNISR